MLGLFENGLPSVVGGTSFNMKISRGRVDYCSVSNAVVFAWLRSRCPICPKSETGPIPCTTERRVSSGGISWGPNGLDFTPVPEVVNCYGMDNNDASDDFLGIVGQSQLSASGPDNGHDQGPNQCPEDRSLPT